MQRDEVEHVLRAAAAIAKEKSFVLVGSQAVVLLLDSPPKELLLSAELDLYPALHPEKADLIDGAIGALSAFHDTFGYHNLIEPEVLLQRIGMLEEAATPVHAISDWARRRITEAQTP